MSRALKNSLPFFLMMLFPVFFITAESATSKNKEIKKCDLLRFRFSSSDRNRRIARQDEASLKNSVNLFIPVRPDSFDHDLRYLIQEIRNSDLFHFSENLSTESRALLSLHKETLVLKDLSDNSPEIRLLWPKVHPDHYDSSLNGLPEEFWKEQKKIMTAEYKNEADILQAIAKLKKTRPSYYTEEVPFTFDPFENADEVVSPPAPIISQKKLPKNLCERWVKIMTAFQLEGKKKGGPAITPISEETTTLLEKYNPALSNRAFYGKDGKCFGMSLPGEDLLASPNSWPVYLKKLTDTLKAYLLASSSQEEEECLKKAESILHEVETKIQNHSMPSNPMNPSS